MPGVGNGDGVYKFMGHNTVMAEAIEATALVCVAVEVLLLTRQSKAAWQGCRGVGRTDTNLSLRQGGFVCEGEVTSVHGGTWFAVS